MSDDIGRVFAALADPTRRWIVETLLRDGSTSVPALTAELSVTRQAVAKHLATLGEAGLIERINGPGREVRYGPRRGALEPALAWLDTTEGRWEERLARLKATVERGADPRV